MGSYMRRERGFQKLDSVLCSQGWIRCRLEPCVWKLYQNSQLCGLIGGHVDDLLVCGSAHDEYFRSKIHELKQSFPFGAWKSAMKESITFCGSELKQNKDFSIELNQEKYADSISEINFTRERKTKQRCSSDRGRKETIQGHFGGTCMEVDSNCSLALCEHVRIYRAATKLPLWKMPWKLNKLVRAQRHYSNTPVFFSSQIDKPLLVTFHDASWSNRRDLSSQGGMVTVLTSENILKGQACPFSPVSWQSKRLPRVCRSSTAAEIQMASTAVDGHEFLKQFLLDLLNEKNISLNVLDACLQKMKSHYCYWQ